MYKDLPCTESLRAKVSTPSPPLDVALTKVRNMLLQICNYIF